MLEKSLYQKYLIPFLCLLLISGCKKKEALRHESEIQSIIDYIQTNNLPLQRNPDTDIFYSIDDSQVTDEVKPTLYADLKLILDYDAQTLDGNSVHSSASTPDTILFDKTIVGLQLLLQEVSIGAKVKAIIPSRLAYRKQGNAVIAPNSPILFDLHLIEIDPHF